MQVVQLQVREEAATFDDFWLIYPRRVAKKDAKRAWDKITPKVQMQALIALADWRQVWLSRGELQYVPHPASWLNGERWDDELPEDFNRSRIVPAANREFAPHVETERAPMPDKLKSLLAELKRRRG